MAKTPTKPKSTLTLAKKPDPIMQEATPFKRAKKVATTMPQPFDAAAQDAPVAAETVGPKKPKQATQPDAEKPPVFRKWKIVELSDLADIPDDQLQKCLHFLVRSIRAARVSKKTLEAFVYNERGICESVFEEDVI